MSLIILVQSSNNGSKIIAKRELCIPFGYDHYGNLTFEQPNSLQGEFLSCGKYWVIHNLLPSELLISSPTSSQIIVLHKNHQYFIPAGAVINTDKQQLIILKNSTAAEVSSASQDLVESNILCTFRFGKLIKTLYLPHNSWLTVGTDSTAKILLPKIGDTKISFKIKFSNNRLLIDSNHIKLRQSDKTFSGFASLEFIEEMLLEIPSLDFCIKFRVVTA